MELNYKRRIHFLLLIFFVLITSVYSQNTEWTVYDKSNTALPGNTINAIAIEGSNKWVGTPDGLAKFDGTNWKVYNTSNSSLGNNDVRSVAIDGIGNKWIGTNGGGVAKFDGTAWTVYNTSNSHLPSNTISSIAIDGSGNKWIGTYSGGLAKFDGTNWTVYNKSNSGLLKDDITSIAIDGSGNKWIGTYYGGLAEYDGVHWTVFNTLNSRLPKDVVTSVAIDGSGNKWIGTTGGGLAKFDGTNWTVYNTSGSGLPGDDVSSVAVDGIGNKWIGTNGLGLAKYDGTNWTAYNSYNSHLPGNTINSIVMDGSGNKWIGTDGGLAIYNQGGVIQLKPQITLSGSSLAFGNVEIKKNLIKTFSITNSGTADLVISNITGNSSAFTASPANFTVTAGGSREVTVTFAPQSAGPYNAALTITHNADGSPASIILEGNGLALPQISFSSNLITFGDVSTGRNKTLSLDINNNGGGDLSVADITCDNGSFSVDRKNFTIAAGKNQSIKVTFSPGENKTYNSVLTVVHNAAGSSSVINLSGNGFVYPASITANSNVVFGSVEDISNYRIIGIPGNTNLSLSQALSGRSIYDWNAYYDAGGDVNYKINYDGSDIFNFRPGNAFWILSKNQLNLSKTVAPVPLSIDNTYSIPLHKGWNLISNPFDKNTAWSRVQEVNSLPSNAVIYSWEGSYGQPAVFAPYKGYYFNNIYSIDSLKIPYNPSGNISGKIAKKTAASNEMNIILIAGSAEAGSVKIGFDKNAGNDFDSLDYFMPPGDFEPARISLYNNSLSTDYKFLMCEKRADAGEGQVFDLEVKNTELKEISLIAEGINVFGTSNVYLLDKKLSKFYNLKDNPKVIIPSVHQYNLYAVMIGDDKFINSKKRELLPEKYFAAQNYPNPFNPATSIIYSLPAESRIKITVFNILGESIAVLKNEVETAGTYEVTWNAQNFSSGIYIYMIEAKSIDGKESFRVTKKMSYVR